MRKVLLFFIIFCLFIFSTSIIRAQTDTPEPVRYGTCDACGFCVVGQNPSDWASVTPPASWDSCRKCLYPSANSNPMSGDTLKIDPETNQPVLPEKGRQYTMIGCIKTELGDFTKEGAAASFVQTVLNLLFSATGVIAFLYLIYGSFVVATSQGDAERLAYGKRVVMGAIIGVIFVMGSVFIVNFIASGVLKIPAFTAPPSP